MKCAQDFAFSEYVETYQVLEQIEILKLKKYNEPQKFPKA